MLNKLVCIYMLIFVLPWTKAEGLEIFNSTHLKLSWYFAYFPENGYYFNINIGTKDIYLNQTQTNIHLAERPVVNYTEYIEYNDGIEYIINITYCYVQYYCNPVRTFNITTPIRLNLEIIECMEDKLQIKLNDSKIDKGHIHLCVSNSNSYILDLNKYPPQSEGFVKACNIPNNSINCNEFDYFIGLLQLEERNIPLKLNITQIKIETKTEIETETEIEIDSETESNNETIIMIGIIGLVCFVLITALTITICVIRCRNRTKIHKRDEIKEMDLLYIEENHGLKL